MFETLLILALLAISAPFLKGRLVQIYPILFAGVLLGIFALTLFVTQIQDTQTMTQKWQWSESFGVSFDLRMDGLGAYFTLLISGVGAAVFLYASQYMKTYARLGYFYSVLSFFTISMFGLVVSDNMIVMFLFWEMTSLCSFLLIGFHSDRAQSIQSARQALIITFTGGVFLLLAIILLANYGLTHGLPLDRALSLSSLSSDIQNATSYPYIIGFLAIAVAAKSAQFPLHFWLPNAMSGPTPVSSFLHSATMVKAGVFLLLKLSENLGGTEMWTFTFFTMGATTMVVSAVFCMTSSDMKRVLAYSTTSALGTLVMLIGVGTDLAIKSAVVFLVAHALYKAALFQITGNVEKEAGTRDLRDLSGLRHRLPLSAAATLLASLSMAGAPPLFGFFGKEMLYMTKLSWDELTVVPLVLAFATNIIMVAVSLKLAIKPFFGAQVTSVPERRKSISLAEVSPLLLAISGFFLGAFPFLFAASIGTDAASAVLGKSIEMKLKIWHGINFTSLFVVFLSALTLALGITLAVKWMLKKDWQPVSLKVIEFDRLFNRFVDGLYHYAGVFTEFIQDGNISNYVRYVFVGVSAVLAVLLFATHGVNIELPSFRVFDIAVLALSGVTLILIAKISELAFRLILLGVLGFVIVLAFGAYGATDVAMTQLLVETLVLLFLLLSMKTFVGKAQVPKNQISSVLMALMMTFFIAVVLLQVDNAIPNAVFDYYQTHSLESAKGKNIVNVILVDFRALDTMGEILVVATALLGVAFMLGKKGGCSE